MKGLLERYIEKDSLIKYDLDEDLFNKYNLNINDIVPIRNVFILCTDTGEKILKKIDYSKEELDFIIEALRYIKNKFTRIAEFDKTNDGEDYCFYNGSLYCIMSLVSGRESDYNNPVDIELISKGIGELHDASEGFRFKDYRKNIIGKAIENFKRRYEETQFFKSIAGMHVNKSEFDDLFLNNVDICLDDIKNSIKILESSSYYKLCSEEDKVVVCHHDLAHHNIIIKDNQAYFIDFDYAVLDLKVHDICNFINKVMRTTGFDLDKSEIILNNYLKTNNLDKRELLVLFGYLYFPEEFYTLSRDYYTRRKEWEESVFIDRLKKRIDHIEERHEFLQNFKDKILNL